VHQQFMLIRSDVAENIVIASERINAGGCSITPRSVRECASYPSVRYSRDGSARVEKSASGQEQRSRSMKDALTWSRGFHPRRADSRRDTQEAAELFEIIRGASEGTSNIFISHKLREVVEIAARIHGRRRGRKSRRFSREGATEKASAHDGGARSSARREKPLARSAMLEVRD